MRIEMFFVCCIRFWITYKSSSRHWGYADLRGLAPHFHLMPRPRPYRSQLNGWNLAPSHTSLCCTCTLAWHWLRAENTKKRCQHSYEPEPGLLVCRLCALLALSFVFSHSVDLFSTLIPTVRSHVSLAILLHVLSLLTRPCEWPPSQCVATPCTAIGDINHLSLPVPLFPHMWFSSSSRGSRSHLSTWPLGRMVRDGEAASHTHKGAVFDKFDRRR